MLAKYLMSLASLVFFLNCNSNTSPNDLNVKECEVDNTVKHDLTFGHHNSVKNGTNSTDADPSNDLKDLDTGLYKKAGEYSLNIKLGLTNFQTVNVVADTGSSDLVINDTVYQPGSSATNQNRPLSLAYGSCSGKATLYKDTVGLSCGQPVQQAFAYMSSAGSSCPNIMGLAYKSISTTCEDVLETCPTCTCTFFGDLVSKTNIQNLFSMLLCGPKSGSQIVLGGHTSNAPIAALQYTPIIEESYYVMSGKSMAIKGGEDLGSLAGQMMILDSGTTLSMIPANIHDKIAAAIKAANPNIPAAFFTSIKPSDEDYTLPASTIGDLSKLPTITLTLAGTSGSPDITLEMSPNVYLKDIGNQNLIFGFRKVDPSEPIIFGQTLMENFYVVFDRGNKQIGFAPNTGLCT